MTNVVPLVSDRCLMPNEQFFSYAMARTRDSLLCSFIFISFLINVTFGEMLMTGCQATFDKNYIENRIFLDKIYGKFKVYLATNTRPPTPL